MVVSTSYIDQLLVEDFGCHFAHPPQPSSSPDMGGDVYYLANKVKCHAHDYVICRNISNTIFHPVSQLLHCTCGACLLIVYRQFTSPFPILNVLAGETMYVSSSKNEWIECNETSMVGIRNQQKQHKKLSRLILSLHPF